MGSYESPFLVGYPYPSNDSLFELALEDTLRNTLFKDGKWDLEFKGLMTGCLEDLNNEIKLIRTKNQEEEKFITQRSNK